MNKSKTYFGIRLLLATVLFFVAFYWLKYEVGASPVKCTEIAKGYTVSVNGKDKQSVNLKNYRLDSLKNGDEITLKVTMPKKSIEAPMIQFTVYHSVVDVLLDGVVIDTINYEQYCKGVILQNGTFWVSLPSDFQGKKLELRLHITEDDAMTTIRPILLQQEKELMRKFVCDNIFEILAAACMLGIGFLLLLGLFIAGKRNKEQRLLVYIGLLCILGAFWLLCYCSILNYFCARTMCYGKLEYMALYGGICVLCVYGYDYQQIERIRRVEKAVAFGVCLFFVTTVVLDSLGVVHMSQFLIPFQMIVCICFIAIIAGTIYAYIKKRETSDRILLLGFVGMLLFALIDLVRFNVIKYISVSASDINVSIIPLGLLILNTTMIISYICKYEDQFKERAKEELLQKMAYTDALTGIGNRAQCVEVLNCDKDEAVTVLFFDLNGLKIVNDRDGHIAGDQLLCVFSSILKNIFKNAEVVGRMGGDEFMVLLHEDKEEVIQNFLANLIKTMDDYNESSTNSFALSVSYGYAMRMMYPKRNNWELYEIADRQMYDCKKKYKAEKGQVL